MTATDPKLKPWRKPWAWADVAEQKKGRQLFAPSRSAEKAYMAQLQDVARNVAQAAAKASSPAQAQKRLDAYSRELEPWAQQAAANMVRKVAKKNEDSWRKAAERWGIDLRGLLDADVSAAINARIAANARLITSIPADVSARVGELARQAVETGMRADTLAAKILEAGNVAHGRAKIIAQTEVSKASTALTQTRAEAVGSEGYIWRTARDGKMRPSHAAMEGKFVKWDSPQSLDGMTGHAGEFPYCRCYPEPVVSASDGQAVAAPMPTRREEEESGQHTLRSQWERQEGSLVVPHQERGPLPNAERAFIPPGKLEGYVLNAKHQRGAHKARVMASALGIGPGDADHLARQIFAQLAKAPAQRHATSPVSEHGESFSAVIAVTGRNGQTLPVRTNWIYDTDKIAGSRGTRPRLVSAWVDI